MPETFHARFPVGTQQGKTLSELILILLSNRGVPKPFKTADCRCLVQLFEYPSSEWLARVHIPAELAFRSLK